MAGMALSLALLTACHQAGPVAPGTYRNTTGNFQETMVVTRTDTLRFQHIVKQGDTTLCNESGPIVEKSFDGGKELTMPTFTSWVDAQKGTLKTKSEPFVQYQMIYFDDPFPMLKHWLTDDYYLRRVDVK
jgi:hypothetical protein